MDAPGVTVLIVDDQPEILRTLTRFLALKGYVVETATSISDAILVLEKGGINAAVIDVRIGSSSGLDLLARMREDERWREIPAVILTGAMLTQDELTIIARQKAHVFVKPKSYQALTQYLDKATGR